MLYYPSYDYPQQQPQPPPPWPPYDPVPLLMPLGLNMNMNMSMAMYHPLPYYDYPLHPQYHHPVYAHIPPFPTDPDLSFTTSSSSTRNGYPSSSSSSPKLPFPLKPPFFDHSEVVEPQEEPQPAVLDVLPPVAAGATPATLPNERNQLNLQRIEEGVDTRTTVMIKNIPNKMSDRDLMSFIERVCPRRIDFFYLRMDFQNGCNVGYAFVNFIHVQDLLGFAKARLGVKWNMFSSEKVLQMSYANYQGKEALVEKFKNSAIMDEREAWRPRIFHSAGLNQGLPEPFPPPTHMRRKERSYFNRGALFVPNSGGVGDNSNTGTHQRNRMQGRFTNNNKISSLDEGKGGGGGGGGGGLSLNGNTPTASTGQQQRWMMVTTRNSGVPLVDGGEGELAGESGEASGG